MDGSLSTKDQTLPILGPARPSPLEEGNKGTKADPLLTYINGGALGLFLGLDKQIFSTARSKHSTVLPFNFPPTPLLLFIHHLLLHRLKKSLLQSQYSLYYFTHTHTRTHTYTFTYIQFTST